MKAVCCGRPTPKILGRIARRWELPTSRRNRQVRISRTAVKGDLVKQCPSCTGNVGDFVEVCPYCGTVAPRSGPRKPGGHTIRVERNGVARRKTVAKPWPA